MDLNLNEAAEEGDTKTLYAAIRNDPFILNDIDKIPFIDTPFHIKASAGKAHFALEIMILKPSLARKLNHDGYSPMHLAVKNGNDQLVIGMLTKDKDLARLVGKEGKTPLHCAATSGKVSLLDQMLSFCGDSIEDLTVKRETALHLAVKCNQNEASQVLVGFINSSHKEEIYWRSDEAGRTVLHYATMGGQLELIESLHKVCELKEWNMRVSTKDGNGQTAIDMARALPGTDTNRNCRIQELVKVVPLNKKLGTPRIEYKWAKVRFYIDVIRKLLDMVKQLPKENRDALLVVLAVVNTTAFQFGLNPPGGFWQDNGISEGKQYFSGTPILATTSPMLYTIISFFTLLGFVISFELIYVLTWGMPIKLLLAPALFSLALGYLIAFAAITRKIRWIIGTVYGLTALSTFIASWAYVLRPFKFKASRYAVHAGRM